MAQEKTEKATPKKRQDSRQKGQVAKSADVNTALILLFMFLFLLFFGSSFIQKLLHIFQHTFTEYALMELTEESVEMLFVGLVIQAAKAAGPILAVAFIAAVASNYLQIGFLFSPEAVQFKPERINPLQGFKRIYSMRAIVEMVKSVLKIACIALVAFFFLWWRKDHLLSLGQLDPASAAAVLGRLIIETGLATSVVLIFISILDFVYQRYDHEKNLRMSKQEVKDEHKKTEGNPEIKSKIKEKQRQMATRRMMQEVPDADVVITNPTHYAVALKYDGDHMEAPVVTAKGAGYIAARIKEIARKHNVITLENRPLARSLYEQGEIGQAIPEAFFKAVAEILAYVYRLQKKV
ncbi:MAG TPA: flagellar biosynthesis protein FlhB [Bacillales bacterium]|nr:flagellar biosynthesis protein FlhB [Bacillales bacterium]